MSDTRSSYNYQTKPVPDRYTANWSFSGGGGFPQPRPAIETPVRIEAGGPPPGVPEFTAHQPHPHAGSSNLIRWILVGGLALVLVLLTFVLLFVLVNQTPHAHTTSSSSPSPSSPASQILTSSTSVVQQQAESLWREFCFNFTTVGDTGAPGRYPGTGSLTSYVSDFTYADVLTDYDVCCEHKEYRLICVSHSTSFNFGNVMVDGEVRWDPGTQEVYLTLLINTDMLLDVECWMTGRYFKT